MTKKNKSSKKTHVKNFTEDFEDTQERGLELLPSSSITRLPPQGPASDTCSSAAREKHNKKSIRPPVLFHREHEEPHGYLSQWYLSCFTDPKTNQTYNCAEQYMMHHKALFRDDLTTAASILATPYPKDQKALGRCVANWDDEAWDTVKEKVVEEGSYLKFSQNKGLKEKLLMTGERELVEASASDRVWGVGFNAKSALSKRDEWGSNLLARERVKEDEAKRV
ncbi:DUF1768-domain-containing protein [Aureobasidium pullulans]|nr:DUF1768-domain-containing protein [Aureobasidium pullulans]